MRRKPRSVRSKIVLALLVPVVALTGLWVIDVKASFADATALRDTYSTRDNVSLPCDRMVAALQAERTQSAEFLATPNGDAGALRTRRAATDAAIAQFQQLSRSYRGSGVSAGITRARFADMAVSLDSLALVRARVDARDATRTSALSGYTGVIRTAFSVSNAAAASSDPLVERVMRTMVAMRRAGELLYQEDALMTGATAAGRFGSGEYLELIQIVGALRFQIPTAGATLPAPDQAKFKSMLSGPAFAALRQAEDQIIGAGRSDGPVTISREVWRATSAPAVGQLFAFLADGYDHAVEFAREARDRILLRFGVSGLLGLLAIVVSLVIAVHIGGSVVRRLFLLRTAATDLARQRLPDLVRRLRAGERIDVDGEAVRLRLGDDEIAEVGAALTDVHLSAVESAAAEAAVRYDLNRVLVNIARRNQTLLDRQIEALGPMDGADSRAYQLAVRMRRHAEHLVILAGSARSRRGHGAESLATILARAAGEMEHAGRVAIGSIGNAEVPEHAVGDLGHLVGELLENAVTFSAPDTSVRLSARRTPDGMVVEIEDHGIGMSPAAVEQTNRRLAQPGEFDPADSARLGLFVVATLAAQHGIKVTLGPTGEGGIRAVVTIPAALAVPIDEAPEAGSTRRSDASRLVGMTVRAGRRPRHAAVQADALP
ncbi:nitrate- and nitrite sensing domain-containing protein [Actinoplanes sp. KI2]|uniref:sensor histidine kinase n=1 Tax=Actinoplanes sp. KI2 TaxID=2983315 RepID=UPI0021D5E4B0|nr:nitrate- and nitrite sensing domain-containing protein [Actinoplanes sp. KI2]MCU7727072.1 nitrate- and nitrite sensing domain-containing protein [Actinoplanes sp. KI2]